MDSPIKLHPTTVKTLKSLSLLQVSQLISACESAIQYMQASESFTVTLNFPTQDPLLCIESLANLITVVSTTHHDTLKPRYTPLSAFLGIECGWSDELITAFSNFLQKGNTENGQVSAALKLYASCLRDHEVKPTIKDIKWRLDYKVTSTFADRDNEPLYFFDFQLDNSSLEIKKKKKMNTGQPFSASKASSSSSTSSSKSQFEIASPSETQLLFQCNLQQLEQLTQSLRIASESMKSMSKQLSQIQKSAE